MNNLLISVVSSNTSEFIRRIEKLLSEVPEGYCWKDFRQSLAFLRHGRQQITFINESN